MFLGSRCWFVSMPAASTLSRLTSGRGPTLGSPLYRTLQGQTLLEWWKRWEKGSLPSRLVFIAAHYKSALNKQQMNELFSLELCAGGLLVLTKETHLNSTSCFILLNCYRLMKCEIFSITYLKTLTCGSRPARTIKFVNIIYCLYLFCICARMFCRLGIASSPLPQLVEVMQSLPWQQMTVCTPCPKPWTSPRVQL